ncbi:MAG: sugar transferase [Pseudomonadota bacterium]
MKPVDKYSFVRFLKLFDLGAMVVAFIFAAAIPYVDFRSLSFSEFLAMKVKVQNVLLFSAFLLLWHVAFSIAGAYTRDRLDKEGWTEVFFLLRVTLYSAMAIWLVTIFVNIELMTKEWLVAFWLMACGISLIGRIGLLGFLRWRRRSIIGRSHLVIVGTNARAVSLAKKISGDPGYGYHLVGFVDEHWPGEEKFRENGYSVVSDFKGFQDYLKDHVVDEVIIGTPIKSLYDSSYRIVEQCEQQGITVRVLSDLFTPTLGRSEVERFEEQTVLTVNTGEMRGPGIQVKHVLDFCISLALLIMLLPFLLLIAVAIKIDSAGPVLFVQERVGLNKRRFKLYKFRTMVSDAEKRLSELEHFNEVSGPVFKIKRDPRITRIGEILRKSSLDEFPQLLNILSGDMSLVGPRPLPVRDYRGFTEDWHRRRFSVRPGITCLWQVCGRNSIPFERWMELDMQYIDQWSLMLDFKILLKTIPAVLKGSGAS